MDDQTIDMSGCPVPSLPGRPIVAVQDKATGTWVFPLAVDLAQASKITGIGKTMFERLYQTGKVKVYRNGTGLLIPVAELERLIGQGVEVWKPKRKSPTPKGQHRKGGRK